MTTLFEHLEYYNKILLFTTKSTTTVWVESWQKCIYLCMLTNDILFFPIWK